MISRLSILEQNDRLISALKAVSTFEVYIFHPTGKKELSFPTSREMVNEVHEPMREGLNEKSWDSTTNLGGKGKTAAQLVKAQVAQQKNAPKRPWRRRTQQDAIRPKEPLRIALDIFQPVGQRTSLFTFLSSSVDADCCNTLVLKLVVWGMVHVAWYSILCIIILSNLTAFQQ